MSRKENFTEVTRLLLENVTRIKCPANKLKVASSKTAQKYFVLSLDFI